METQNTRCGALSALLVSIALITATQVTIAQDAQPVATPAENPQSADAQPSDVTDAVGEQPPNAGAATATQTVDTVPVVKVANEPSESLSTPVSESEEAVRLEDVLVTASRHLKTQRDIPGSVSALRGQDLEGLHAQGLKDYLKLVPGVSFADQGNETSIPIIRGIGANTDLITGDVGATTGVYVDEMPFSDLLRGYSIPDLNPFDLERVEVLKGPQGTLFGSGALAGAVRYILQKPQFGMWEAKVSETLTQTQGGGGLAKVTAGAINIPLFGSSLAIRAVGLYRTDPGLYDLSATADTGGMLGGVIGGILGGGDSADNGNSLRDDRDADRTRQTSGRVLLSWRPLDEVNLSAAYFLQKTHHYDLGLADQDQTFTNDQVPFASPSDHDFTGLNLTMSYDWTWGRLLSISNRMTKHNYVDIDAGYAADLEHQNQLDFFNITADDVTGYTQELRLVSPEGADGKWTWLVGGSFLRYGDADWADNNVGPHGEHPKNPDDVSQLDRDHAIFFVTGYKLATETAVFAEATRRLGERWEVTLGARGYRTHLNADSTMSGLLVETQLQTEKYQQHFDDTQSGFNPRISLRYAHNRHLQWYALASKGFQFGGIQFTPPNPGFSQGAAESGFDTGPYKSSKLWNYETGIRTEWFDRRVRFDIGAFYLDWRELQLVVQIPIFHTNLTYPLIANVGRAHSEGLEAAFEAAPFRGARVSSSASWMKAETDEPFDTANPSGPVPAGTRLPGSPKFQWSNVISYEHSLPFFDSWTGGLFVTHAHVGSAPDAIRATGMVGGYDTVDARLVLTEPGARLLPEISLGVTNLTNAHSTTYHSQTVSLVKGEVFDFYHFIQPRTILLGVSLKFWWS